MPSPISVLFGKFAHFLDTHTSPPSAETSVRLNNLNFSQLLQTMMTDNGK